MTRVGAQPLDRARWLLFGALLVVVFAVSTGAGAWLRGQGSGDTLVSAVATLTPTPAITGDVTPTPAVPTASSAATTASPAPPTPTPVPPTPSPAPTPSPLPATEPPHVDPATAEQFANDLLVAFQRGDTVYLFDRLHQAVFDRYGERQCRHHVNGFGPDPSSTWTVVSSSGPAPWSWETDNLVTTSDDTWTVTVDEPGTGQRDLHFSPNDGKWRWFLDCGDSR